ncbi:MAG: glycerol kinase [Thermoleophilaceae bacterium]|nr:glycerol kinase [Thermoleophilaceae bacterium]
MTLLLGVDEGTSAVKAVLFDLDLRPLAETRREKALAHPRPGWVEQDPDDVLTTVVDAIAEVLRGADGEVVCGLDHQGESVLAWDADSGAPITPIVTWQDKRSQEVLDGLERDGRADEVRRLSGMPLDPYFSAGKLAWLLEHETAVARARDAGTLRLGTVDSWLCDMLGAGFATDPSTASRTQLAVPGEPQWDPRLLEVFGVPGDALPALQDTAGDLGTLRHPDWPRELPLAACCVDQQAALAGAGCVEPGLVKATYGTGVFVLAHVGDERPTAGDGGLLPTVAWRVGGRVEYALDGGVFTAGALLEWLSRDLGLAEDPAALAALAASVPDSGGVRVLPALAGLGAPWWRPDAKAVIAGLAGRSRPAHVARAALEAIAWRVADVLAAVAQQVELESLRVDGGLTRNRLLLQLQADAAGVPVAPGAIDATAAGAAALAAVGAGLWRSTREIGQRIPTGALVRPERDDAWRREAHAEWRRFVEGAAALR